MTWIIGSETNKTNSNGDKYVGGFENKVWHPVAKLIKPFPPTFK